MLLEECGADGSGPGPGDAVLLGWTGTEPEAERGLLSRLVESGTFIIGIGPEPTTEAAQQQLAALDDAMFRKFFAGSPIKRTGRERFVRNVLIAIGNSGDKTLAPTAEALVNDESSLVSDTARWALGRLVKLDENQEPYNPSAQPTTDSVKGETP